MLSYGQHLPAVFPCGTYAISARHAALAASSLEKTDTPGMWIYTCVMGRAKIAVVDGLWNRVNKNMALMATKWYGRGREGMAHVGGTQPRG